ncbi:DUF1329 domain-containing protein [Pseudothauera rhizosphaerae]|uniref:DUF1329 domain-containing protein n=1 Tax=Pseudothauera rhizosphaerae TaxID=2565932 RepID=A0A4S4ALJ5_9RHOO|nr:DUF1329 domain-containing protein [Pseudothauera rhizosphaerae]THF60359.1 DUF1329 domain-containing protein [Pseudothauera rhizosphaerae]
MKTHIKLLSATIVALLIGSAHAAVTQEEADQLKTTLTPLGAERAGNKDGSIPEWKGCPDLKAPLDKLKAGDRRWDPYANEKPLYSVTAANMAQYEDKLSEGVKALLAKYPQTMRLDVYPTHRNHCAPDYVYENTYKNATRAKYVTNGKEDGVEGAVAGIPFPIPKNGIEVRWNLNMRWRGVAFESKDRHYSFTSSGQPVLGSQAHQFEQYDAYQEGLTPEEHAKQGYPNFKFMQFVDQPTFRAGEGLMVLDSTNCTVQDRQAWQYLVGQRRVRRAPTVGWDTPDFVVSGSNFFDEVFGSVLSCNERYEYKLLGKKEMLIPYNNNKLFSLTEKEMFGQNHHNPDVLRWELHRVWVVEATLKDGKRHAVQKRKFYVDEDTWSTAMFDGWDHSGKIWRVSISPAYYFPDVPGMLIHNDFLYVLDGAWSTRGVMYEPGFQMRQIPMKSKTEFGPDTLSARNIR